MPLPEALSLRYARSDDVSPIDCLFGVNRDAIDHGCVGRHYGRARQDLWTTLGLHPHRVILDHSITWAPVDAHITAAQARAARASPAAR